MVTAGQTERPAVTMGFRFFETPCMLPAPGLDKLLEEAFGKSLWGVGKRLKERKGPKGLKARECYGI